jgi:hypothetical protein
LPCHFAMSFCHVILPCHFAMSFCHVILPCNTVVFHPAVCHSDIQLQVILMYAIQQFVFILHVILLCHYVVSHSAISLFCIS